MKSEINQGTFKKLINDWYGNNQKIDEAMNICKTKNQN